MSKATLEFDLSDIEESEQFDITVRAMDFYLAIGDLRKHLRNVLKYDGSISEEKEAAYEEIKDLLYDILETRNITGFDY